ncbi:RNA-directed DNA polymerase, eukaryota, reverse transcriptase zinc-binding domain protein [Tanacetum coccineum]|uniref:RNA-directed DNA polymerase, eukaryota, reverse transcriptase zinc-binding domain protein n=1 Tax=Tanacetum coccineum TaxID=301880 RepID=A0ABQ5IGI4_9ASTR
MRTKRNTKIPNKFEDSVHSINNSKTTKKNGPKKIDVSKKNLDVFGNGVEKDKESIGSEGSDRDDCVVTNDEREKSDARREDRKDGTTGIEEIAKNVQSGSNPVNEPANDEINESSDNDKGKFKGEHMENCHKEVNDASKTYAHIVKHDEFPKNLDYIPTLITEYNIRRMWGKFGVSDIDANKNGQYVFKFRDSNGLNAVLDKGPWMIVNVPLEAWSVEGISAIASSLGKPMMMDTNTAAMCHKGIGNFDFARVLVEMDAEKELKKEIVIQYRDKNNNVKGSKTVKVVYDWMPPACTKCKVFGHDNRHCRKGGGINGNDTNSLETSNDDKEINQGFRSNSTFGDNAAKTQGHRNGSNSQWQYNGNERGRTTDGRRQEFRKRPMDVDNQNKEVTGNKVQHKKWNVKEKHVEEIRKTANKLFVLNSHSEDNDQEVRTLKERMIVDKFLNQKLQPTLIESMTWSKDMIHYFKEKWEENIIKERNEGIKEVEVEDVLSNSNGTGNFMKANEVNGMKGSILNEDGYGVCAVLETRLKCKKLQKSCDKVFHDWEWVSNMEFKCYYSFVYAANEGVERRELWRTLVNDNRYVNGKPWCIAGDMNVIMHPNEHSCGSSIMSTDMMEFHDCLNTIEVEDLCRSGLHFTWTKNLHKAKMGIMTGVLKKLDRILSNEGFIKDFPQAHAKFLPYLISDHTPAILCIPSNVKKKIKSFRFSNYIADKQEFIPIVKDKWNQDIHGYKMYQVVKKLKSLKVPLRRLEWSKGNLFKRVECLRVQLQDIQTSIDVDPYDHSLRIKEAKLVKDFCEAESDEENFLHQQAKIKWLCGGDKNSSYFHSVLKGRNNKSKVFSLRDNHGNSYDYDQIPQLFLKHFENFLGSAYPVQEIESSDTLFKEKLSTAHASKMIADISEIKRALFDIKDTKAPGPDGFTAAFFKQAWSIIGADSCAAVKEFFSSGKMLGELNATLVSLIPKVQTLKRIKPFLEKLVSCNQSAFILGRHIHDNILLTQEIMRGCNRKGGPKRVAFKIDIQKAYDTVNWEFLKKVLEGFGFHEKMVNWIMQCVTTAAFTLNVNGDRIGYFKGGRGLRQGGPISPYLFTLIMEVFSLILLREIDHEPNFQYHFGCKDIKLSHVCFADDLLVMCHGDAISVGVIKKALDAFSAVSGLIPNNSKSTAFYGSMSDDECNTISSILLFVTGKLPVKYLGVPLIAKRLGEDYSLLQESIHVYWASVFLLPTTVINDINKLLKTFLWSQSDTAKGKAKVAWSSICKPNDQGGLGLKDLQIWNQALLSKHVWDIAGMKESLWVKWVHSVKLRGKSIWEISVDQEDSWGWKNLLSIKDQIKDRVAYKIGNGRNVSMWFDNWSDIGPLFQHITYRDLYDERLDRGLKVSDLIDNDGWKWPNDWYGKFPMITSLNVPTIAADIDDKLAWKTSKGMITEFSVTSVYHDLRGQSPIAPWWKLIWFAQCIPKHSFIMWLAIQDRLTTQDKLQRWGNQAVNRCCLCLNHSEDLKHLFFQCSFSTDVWNRAQLMGDMKINMNDWQSVIQGMIDAGNGDNIKSILRRLLLAACVYHIWQERNNRIFKDSMKSGVEIFKGLVEVIKYKLLGITMKDSKVVTDMEVKRKISCKKYKQMENLLQKVHAEVPKCAPNMIKECLDSGSMTTLVGCYAKQCGILACHMMYGIFQTSMSNLALGENWIGLMKDERSNFRRCTIRKDFPSDIKGLGGQCIYPVCTVKGGFGWFYLRVGVSLPVMPLHLSFGPILVRGDLGASILIVLVWMLLIENSCLAEEIFVQGYLPSCIRELLLLYSVVAVYSALYRISISV